MNPDEPLRTKNLAEEDPAPMDDTLGVYPWLPRMIDKARASGVDALGGYFKYPCPIDREALVHLGITAEGFAKVANEAADGRDLLDRLVGMGADVDRLRPFDPVALNTALHRNGS